MSEPPLRVFDWNRIFFGAQPPLYLAEVAFRTTVVFAWTLLLLRLLGKRGIAQLSLFEVTIIIGLGSAVGDPMFHEDVPLLHAMLSITVIVGLYRLFLLVVRRVHGFRRFVEGNATCLVADGRVDPRALEAERLAPEELFEVLRTKGISQLGEVKRAYLERSGEISVFSFPPKEVVPGLAIVPPASIGDGDPEATDAQLSKSDGWACCRCGAPGRGMDRAALGACTTCACTRWGRKTTSPLDDGDLSPGRGAEGAPSSA